ncbi:hypothetical protein CGRA01v4_14114 [Colletotrichum graminicola]|nr:hypothetical protein CGRA01v4_14114 [Colletotrichum graminicola]
MSLSLSLSLSLPSGTTLSCPPPASPNFLLFPTTAYIVAASNRHTGPGIKVTDRVGRSKRSPHALSHNHTLIHSTRTPTPPCRPNARRGRQEAPPSRTRHTEPSRCDARGHWPVPCTSLFPVYFPVTQGSSGGAALVAGGVCQKRVHKPI